MPKSHGMREVETTFQEASSNEVFDGSHTLDASVDTDYIDLLTKTPYPGGLAVVVDIRTSPTDADETCDIDIECADETDFSDVVTVASFTQITDTSGVNGDGTDTYVKRFYTNKRYVRLEITLGGTTPNFGTPKIYLVKDGDERNQ